MAIVIATLTIVTEPFSVAEASEHEGVSMDMADFYCVYSINLGENFSGFPSLYPSKLVGAKNEILYDIWQVDLKE